MLPNLDLKIYLNQIHPLEDEVVEEYCTHWKQVEYKRKAFITNEGEVEQYMYFVQEGIQKSYYLNEGKEHVVAFTYPPSFSGIPESFFTQAPSNCFLQCITASRLLRIHRTQHQAMMQKHRVLETLFRIGTEQVLVGIIKRHYELLAHDIETRFKIFTSRSPHILNMIPHKDIASYLRIDPTNFSKLLKRVKINPQ